MSIELDNIPGDIAAAIEAGRALGRNQIHELNGAPFMVTDDNESITNLEHLLMKPRRIQQRVTASDAQSFTEYYNRYSNDDSVIFCDIKAGRFKAIIDYHGKDSPERCDHILLFDVENTQEWDEWNKHSGSKMDQVEFAMFIEDNLDEIVDPVGATMLEIALSLNATTKTIFKSGTRLHDGQVQLEFVEDIKGSAGAMGNLTIPETIRLGIRPFRGAERYELNAKFRYRINQGRLVMWYDLKRPESVFETAIAGELTVIEKNTKSNLVIHCANLERTT